MSTPCHDKCQQPPAGAAFGTDLSLAELKQRVGTAGLDSDVYYYVVGTVKLDQGRFCQEGSAPNFQGGRLTLCTCKHWMRSRRQADQWTGTWVAGFTSIREGGFNSLFFLTRVETAYTSFLSLWFSGGLSPSVLAAKNASLCRFGDLYEPKSQGIPPHLVDSYRQPVSGHCHEHNWLLDRDIRYSAKSRPGVPPPLLVGMREASYLWNRPSILLASKLGRGHRRSPFRSFLAQLTQIP